MVSGNTNICTQLAIVLEWYDNRTVDREQALLIIEVLMQGITVDRAIRQYERVKRLISET